MNTNSLNATRIFKHHNTIVYNMKIIQQYSDLLKITFNRVIKQFEFLKTLYMYVS